MLRLTHAWRECAQELWQETNVRSSGIIHIIYWFWLFIFFFDLLTFSRVFLWCSNLNCEDTVASCKCIKWLVFSERFCTVRLYWAGDNLGCFFSNVVPCVKLVHILSVHVKSLPNSCDTVINFWILMLSSMMSVLKDKIPQQ